MASQILWASGYAGQIYTLSFSPSNSSLSILSQVNCGTAPTWIQKHPTLPLLYACDEFAKDEGVVYRYEIGENGTLKENGKTKTGGEGPVHLVFDKSLNHLYVANYSGAVLASIPVDPNDGTFLSSSPEQVFKYTGQGPQEDRQEVPHPHGVFLDPIGTLLFCVDLGTDQIHIYKIGDTLIELPSLKVTPGNGPRHITFGTSDKNGTILYLVNELSNTVGVYSIDYSTSTPTFTLLQPESETSVLPSSSPNAKGFTAACICLTSSSSHLIISNRSPDVPEFSSKSDILAIFPLAKDGTLEVKEKREVEVGGRGLRCFAIGREGRVAVGCQKTNEVVVMDGGMKEVARVGGVEEVTCVVWA